MFKKQQLRLRDGNKKIKKKWIANLSKYKQLTKEQTLVLEKGLNFVIAHRSIPKSKY